LFWYWLIGLFSSAAVAVDAGGTLASVVVFVVVVVEVVALVLASETAVLFPLLAGVHAATARARTA
jgi:hypothetical protein